LERISSRKNQFIVHLRSLERREYRRETGLFLCDGEKLLREALSCGAEIAEVLWAEGAEALNVPGAAEYVCPPELLQYASPMKNSPGPLFTVRMKRDDGRLTAKSAIVLETVQDPGNVGTVIRTANAMGIDAVVLLGGCADPYGPKTVRSTMGAIFRQRLIETDLEGLRSFVKENNLTLLGAALGGGASDIRGADLSRPAVAIGSEGRGLSGELLDMCSARIVIPMEPESESLNAAVAASIAMWEIYRRQGR